MLRVTRHWYRAGLRQPVHAHEMTTVTMLLRGTLEERSRGQLELARPFSFVVKPAGCEHSDVFHEDVTAIQILVQESEVAGLERWNASLGIWRWQHGGPPCRSFLSLWAALKASDSPTSEPVQRRAIDALASTCPIGTAPRGASPAWLAIVREALDDERDRPPSVNQLAGAAGVHPVYLARQFRRWFGCSITEYLRRRRVASAARAISVGGESLGSASHRVGFADQAHMCRVFKGETGLTPLAFRRLVAG